jgi:hypothetical protein
MKMDNPGSPKAAKTAPTQSIDIVSRNDYFHIKKVVSSFEATPFLFSGYFLLFHHRQASTALGAENNNRPKK